MSLSQSQLQPQPHPQELAPVDDMAHPPSLITYRPSFEPFTTDRESPSPCCN